MGLTRFGAIPRVGSPKRLEAAGILALARFLLSLLGSRVPVDVAAALKYVDVESLLALELAAQALGARLLGSRLAQLGVHLDSAVGR